LIKKNEVSIQKKKKKKRMRGKWDVNVAGLVALIAAVGKTSNNIMWSPFFLSFYHLFALMILISQASNMKHQPAIFFPFCFSWFL
jgi:uncharacterized membrane protein